MQSRRKIDQNISVLTQPEKTLFKILHKEIENDEVPVKDIISVSSDIHSSDDEKELTRLIQEENFHQKKSVIIEQVEKPVI